MDSKQTIRLNVNEDELQEIANRLGIKIAQHGDIIEIEGDEAEIDQAMHDIMELEQQELPDENDGILFIGNIINGDTHKDAYFKYKLLEYDSKSNRWKCDIQKKIRHWHNGKPQYQTMDVGKWWVPESELLEEHFSGRK